MADQVLTLAQFAQLEKDPLQKGIMMGITQHSVVADLLTFRSIGGLSESGVRFDEVITPDWVALDGTISSKRANAKPLSYSVHQMAVHVDVPLLLEQQDKNQLARLSVQNVKLAIKGSAYVVNDAFINGDHAAEPNQFEGLNKLVSTMGTSQTVGASEIDISDGGDASKQHSLIDRIDEAIDVVEGGAPDAAFCNRQFALKFRSVIRRAGLMGNTYDWIRDGFKTTDPRKTQRTASTRPAFVYNGAGTPVPFYIIDKKADQTTNIIGNTYSEGGSTGASTRLFFVKFGAEDLEGIQAKGLETKDIGLLEDKENIRKRVVWSPGIAVWGPRSISKAVGIKVA